MVKKRGKGVPAIIGISGFVLIFLSLIAIFNNVHNWHFLAAIGVWFFSDYLASKKTKDTALQILMRDKKKFLKLYFIMFLIGIIIEIIGRFILQFWSYSFINSPIFELVLLIYYPFILFSFRELYVAFTRATEKKWMAMIIVMLIGVLLWQVGGFFSGDWDYQVQSYSNLKLFNLHFFFIIGSALLVLIPVYVYRNIFNLKE
ncbi:hypothetical protein HYW75_06965 [Candidatus Pacearchaeota archaeon]|nr:hypothetical protein [Candidatus Pacearchaeota archaeon]